MFSWNLVTLKTELEKASSCTWDRSWCVFQGLCQQIKPHTLLSLDGGGVVVLPRAGMLELVDSQGRPSPL